MEIYGMIYSINLWNLFHKFMEWFIQSAFKKSATKNTVPRKIVLQKQRSDKDFFKQTKTEGLQYY